MRIRFNSLAGLIALSFGLVFFSSLCYSANLVATVVDSGGRPLHNFVVLAVPLKASTPALNRDESAVMDQIDKEFVPEILVVRTGTSVAFPNSDSVAHQVYSFSPAKHFALPLYRRYTRPTVIFDQPGIVTLGCNIHDQMVGYIFVTDSPYFSATNTQGVATLQNVPTGDYRVRIWSPRMMEAPSEQMVSIKNSDATANFKLVNALRAERKKINDRIRDY